MTYLLRLVACLFLCVSLNSFGETVYIQASGLITDSSSPSISIGDYWQANLTFENVSNDLTPQSLSAELSGDIVDGSFSINNLQVPILSSTPSTIKAKPWPGLDELFFLGI